MKTKVKEKILTELEQKKIVRLVKKRELTSLSYFFQSFCGNIASGYRLYSCDEDNFSYEDFYQECLASVIKKVNSFEGNTYGQLRKFIKTAIWHAAKDIAEKHKNQNNYNILGDDSEEVHELSSREQKDSMEIEVVNRLTFEHSFQKFIRKKLTKKQFNIFKAFYFQECPRKYELENGMKPRSFNRALDRVLKKVGKIIETQEFMDFHFLSVPPRYMITE